jgi:uncharacterized membrane protein
MVAAISLLFPILLHLFSAGKPGPCFRRVDRPRRAAFLQWLVPLSLLFLGLVLFPVLVHEDCGVWGAGVCHRITERSFVVAGVQLPLCARCTGIYLGFLATVAVCVLRGRRRPAVLPPRGIMILLLFFLVVVGVDGLNSYFALFPGFPHLYEPHNTLRVLTGSLEGVALAGLLWPVFHMSLWEIPEETRSIPNLRELGWILLAALGLDLLALWHPPASLYPLVLLSLAGLFLALGVVSTLLVSVVARKAGRVTRWREVGVLFAWGLLVTLAELAAFAWARYLLIGSFSFTLS